MDSSSYYNAEGLREEGRVIVRRFTDELTGANTLEQQVKEVQVKSDEDEREEERQRLRYLYESPAELQASPEDFEVAEIARLELQKVIDKFKNDATSTLRERFGIPGKSSKVKAVELLEQSVQTDFNGLKEALDGLEKTWTENNGAIYKAFKKVAGTLDDHKSIFQIFPSQNNYASAICGSLSCLLKAAKTHSDIAKLLSESIASISDKVSRCSNIIMVIKTRGVRRLLADIYARMFKFYQDTIEWYLRSKPSRAFKAFNENLVKDFTDATNELEKQVNELYREASIANGAMIAIMFADGTALKAQSRHQRPRYAPQDFSAGYRMRSMLEATWMKVQSLEWTIERAQRIFLESQPQTQVRDIVRSSMTRAEARAYSAILEPLIVGEEGQTLFSAGSLYLAEDKDLFRVREWMTENKTSRTLWISSPYEPGNTISGSRAAALATVAAAWQAETPLISHFCKRPGLSEMREDMTIEQVGLIGLVYSLIHQLLQLNSDEEELDISEDQLIALNGSIESWDYGLQVLQVLLNHTPTLMFCVIDGLGDLAWGNGGDWCSQLLDTLIAKQKQKGVVFNILLTTTGHSKVLPEYIQLEDRYVGTKKAREISRLSRKLDLRPPEKSN